LYLLLLN